MKGKPLYHEVSDKLLSDIKSSRYHENSLLPSERELCKSYNVSRSTIRQALSLLEKEGCIYKMQGKGTFVKPKVYEQRLTKFYSFTEEFKNLNNIVIGNKIIKYELVHLDSKLSSKLSRQEGEVFHRLTRLRSADGSPLMIENTYLPQNRFYTIDTELLSTQPLYSYLSKLYNISFDRAIETFKPVLPRREECNLLGISPRTPCMLLEKYTYERSYIIEYTLSIIRGDKFTFKVDLLSS